MLRRAHADNRLEVVGMRTHSKLPSLLTARIDPRQQKSPPPTAQLRVRQRPLKLDGVR